MPFRCAQEADSRMIQHPPEIMQETHRVDQVLDDVNADDNRFAQDLVWNGTGPNGMPSTTLIEMGVGVDPGDREAWRAGRRLVAIPALDGDDVPTVEPPGKMSGEGIDVWHHPTAGDSARQSI